MNERFAHDLRHAGGGLVAGADEAGRGCLAGPIVAAAVCFDYSTWHDADFVLLDRLDDSKRLTAKRRDEAYLQVVRRAVQVVVVALSSDAIDRRGLHVCNLEALGGALELLDPCPSTAFVDGFALRGCDVAHEKLIGGDHRSAAVAAASVVAKVTRDRLMARLHERWPQYGFDRHVGYACAAHHAAIAEHGVCELHRLSFNSVAFRQLGLGV